MQDVKKTISIITLGCKVNQYESACIADDFLKHGYELVAGSDPADIYIINSCTVTNRTDFKSRNAIRRVLAIKQENPATVLIVTGCYAELNEQQIAGLGDVDLVIGNDFKGSVFDLLNAAEKVQHKPDENLFSEMATDIMPDRVRAFIKIQDGCDCFCSYCIVPFARGKPRSRTPQNVIAQIKRLAIAGYKEFVIAGINLGLYGRDLSSGYSLAKILRDIEELPGVERIRISSIEPQLIDGELLNYISESKKLCPHFHIPLQSGCNEMLQRMNRGYDTAAFAGILESIVCLMPDVAIGTDLILGLPGETEEMFQQTCDFMKSLPIAYAHIFPYSKRSGTVAASMEGQVRHSIAKERCRMIAAITEAKKQAYIDCLIRNRTVLGGIIEGLQDGYGTALSDHYIRMYVQDKRVGEGDFVTLPASKRFLDGVLVSW